MLPTDPQFLYVILILPSLFGITLIGDGINKVVHEDHGGFISVVFGVIFLVAVVLTYFVFSTILLNQ